MNLSNNKKIGFLNKLQFSGNNIIQIKQVVYLKKGEEGQEESGACRVNSI